MRIVSALSLALFVAGTACAGGPPAVVSARTLLATDGVHPGQTARIAVVARIEPGYHINDHKPSLDYLIPTRVVFEASPALKVERVIYPHGKPMNFDFLDSPILVYEGEIRLGSILKVGDSTQPGSYPLRGKFTYQACNNYACLPPASVLFEASVRVVPSSIPLKPVNSEIFKAINFK
jgi:Thiol:disulfide interchange protein DsbD, N-terminal